MQSLLISSFFIFGMLAGSFFQVLIVRLYHKQGGIIAGRSACPLCHHRLAWYDLLPLVSYALLLGKCRYCQKPISTGYFWIELVTAFCFAFLPYYFPFGAETNLVGYLLLLSVYIFIISSLLVIAFYDAYFSIIPDGISVPVIVIALATTAFPFTPTLTQAILGALIPFGFFLAQIMLSGGRWIGGGDLRLAIIMGIVLGPSKVFVALFLAYLTGSIIGLLFVIFRKKGLKERMPFGPFLCFGTFIALFYGQALIDWYFGLMGL